MSAPPRRVQFAAPCREQHIANRQFGTVEQIDSQGNLQVRLESRQEVQFNIREHPHVDYGYAVTSHSSQGATADRGLVHVDTEHAREELINSRLAYVSVSRGGGTMRRIACTLRRSLVFRKESN